jgi:hypothetical protein
MIAFRPVPYFSLLIWLICLFPALADGVPLGGFCGDYEGQTISSTENGLSKRDLSVSIRDCDKGFTVNWTTITHKRDGRLKRKSYTIDFRPTERETVFASAMRTNMFGGKVPLDPLKGDPYVWARVSGATLTVFALIVTHDGGYEMQVYDRTIAENGLDLKFSRFRDGVQLKQITGKLIRTGG